MNTPVRINKNKILYFKGSPAYAFQHCKMVFLTIWPWRRSPLVECSGILLLLSLVVVVAVYSSSSSCCCCCINGDVRFVSVSAPSMPNFTTATLGRRGLNVTWWSQDGASYAAGTTFTVHYRRLGTVPAMPTSCFIRLSSAALWW